MCVCVCGGGDGGGGTQQPMMVENAMCGRRECRIACTEPRAQLAVLRHHMHRARVAACLIDLKATGRVVEPVADVWQLRVVCGH